MITLHTIPGFLGKPSDWNFLSNPSLVTKEMIHHDLNDYDPKKGLTGWVEKFNSKISDSKDKKILMGYSLGGRLALSSLLDAPHLWEKAIIISADPGILNQKECELREKNDRRWAERFLKEPWPQLMKEWNNQPVFDNSIEISRKEEDYSRLHLAESLIYWSVSKQQDLFFRFTQLSKPILWIAGENDLKYVSIAKKWAEVSKKNKLWIAPKAGHRVPWQVPELFIDRISKFLE